MDRILEGHIMSNQIAESGVAAATAKGMANENRSHRKLRGALGVGALFSSLWQRPRLWL